VIKTAPNIQIVIASAAKQSSFLTFWIAASACGPLAMTVNVGRLSKKSRMRTIEEAVRLFKKRANELMDVFDLIENRKFGESKKAGTN
jgi:hypothetical protein